MKTYLQCPDMVSFFAAKNELTEKGYTYVPSKPLFVSRGKNHIVIDHEICVFAICSRFDYELKKQ